MRVVLDTGVLIAALITKDTPPDRIYRAWRDQRFELVTSEWQLDEFRRVTRYQKLRKFLKPSEAGNIVNGLRHQARVLRELPTVDESRDPHDNPILAMALVSQAAYLVSGDKRDVLVLKKIGTTRIITARRFLGVLEKEAQ